MKYVLANKLASLTGLSVAAINAKRTQGKWLEGIHWRKSAEERTIYYCLPAIERWVEGKLS
ncbi:MAG: excisionase family protein [Ghiorsea sp.]